MRSTARILPIVLTVLSGCSPTSPPLCAAGTGEPMLVYQLYFGRTIHSSGFVSDEAWRTFRDTVITPNLPKGYTVLDADGAWAGANGGGTKSDPTKLLIVALPNNADSRAPIARIRSAYQTQFSQESVGMIVQPACGQF